MCYASILTTQNRIPVETMASFQDHKSKIHLALKLISLQFNRYPENEKRKTKPQTTRK